MFNKFCILYKKNYYALKYIKEFQNLNKIISTYFKLKDLNNVYEIFTTNVTLL